MKKLFLRFLLFPLTMAGCLFTTAQTVYVPQKGDAVTTDDGKYVVKGNNLITNPSFETGFDGWTAGDGTALTETNFAVVSGGGPDGSACLKALANGGSGKAASIKTGWAIESGKTYLFSCWALRTADGMKSNTGYSKLFEGDTQTSTTSQVGTLSYTADTWTQSKVIFTATKSFCVANFGWLNGASSFDCFFLGEVELSKELVKDKLVALISYTDSVYNSTASNEGTGINQFTSEVRASFLSAINTAQSALTSATTQVEINASYATLNTAMTTFYASQNPPFVTGEKYFIIHKGSGLFLTSAGNTGKAISVTTNTNLNTQIFTFEKAPEGSAATGYNMKDADGNYVYRSGSWDAFSGTTTLTENNAIFNAVKDGDYYQLKNMGSGSVLGTDASIEGALVYSNKNGAGVANNDWTIKKYTVTVALDAMIAKVEDVIATTTVGDEFGEVSQSAFNAITTALATGKTAAATVTTFENANKAMVELQTALTAFYASFNPLKAFDTSKTYSITHAEGNALTVTTTGNATITEAAADKSTAEFQRMTLVAVPCDTLSMLYKIRSTDRDSLYLATSGTYNTVWQTKNDTTAAIFQLVQNDGKYIGIRCLSNDKYLGTDGVVSGTAVYSDKAGEGNDNAHWNIDVFRIKSALDKTVFEAWLTKADSLASQMVQGYKVGQYYLTDINAFAKIISEARSEADGATTQVTVDSLATSVQDDFATYKAKAHASDCAIADYIADLIVAYTVEYDAAVTGTEKGQYTAKVKQTFYDAMQAAGKDAATEETLQTLLTAHDKFLASVNNVDFSSLNTLIANANTSLANAVAGDYDGQYSQASIDTFKKAINDAQTFYDKKSGTQAQVDSVSLTLKTASATFASAVIKIDFSTLVKTITEAKDTIANASEEKGDGAGLYPKSAFNRLQTVIDKATAMNNSKTVNQTHVNAFVDTLSAAIDTFKNARIPNDYSNLDSLLTVAKDLYEKTPVGSGSGMASEDMHNYLKESIDKNGLAKTSTSQSEIDKAAKLLKRDIALFRQDVATNISSEELAAVKITGENGFIEISNLPANTTSVSVYDAGGKIQYHSDSSADVKVNMEKGTYIVKVVSMNGNRTKRLQIR